MITGELQQESSGSPIAPKRKRSSDIQITENGDDDKIKIKSTDRKETRNKGNPSSVKLPPISNDDTEVSVSESEDEQEDSTKTIAVKKSTGDDDDDNRVQENINEVRVGNWRPKSQGGDDDRTPDKSDVASADDDDNDSDDDDGDDDDDNNDDDD